MLKCPTCGGELPHKEGLFVCVCGRQIDIHYKPVEGCNKQKHLSAKAHRLRERAKRKSQRDKFR